jgi:hypothetical protein
MSKKNIALGMQCIPRGIRTGDPWYIHNKVGVGKLVDTPDLARQMDIHINFSSFANCPSSPPGVYFPRTTCAGKYGIEYVVCRRSFVISEQLDVIAYSSPFSV